MINWHFINLLAYAFMVLFNYLSISLPIGGKLASEVSDKYQTLITPDNFTFSIWALIYGSLAFYVLYSFLVGYSGVLKDDLINKIAIPFFISCIFNSIWLFAWQYEKIALSVFIIIGLLLSLIYIAVKANINFFEKINFSKGVVFIPFSIYLGWVSVATIVNISAFLVSLGFRGGRYEHIFAVVILSVAGLLSVLAIVLKNNIPFSLTVAWASFGIYSKASSLLNEKGQFAYKSVSYAALGVLILSLIFSLYGIARFLRTGANLDVVKE
ncbi:MAG: hypothetical protein N2440_03970 [Actinobacteria bacterium]|nr:hypothetical protein [Actinomycetota bacterium]